MFHKLLRHLPQLKLSKHLQLDMELILIFKDILNILLRNHGGVTETSYPQIDHKVIG